MPKKYKDLDKKFYKKNVLPVLEEFDIAYSKK
jgi:hypothetical protein